MRWFAPALCVLAGPALAQGVGASVSASDWTVAGRTVVLRVSLPDSRGRGESGTVLANDVLDHAAVRAGEAACPAIDQGEGVGRVDVLASLPGLRRFEVVFECPAQGVPVGAPMGTLRLDDHILFDRDPGHLDFARLHLPRGEATVLFDAAHGSATVTADGDAPAPPVVRYLRLGFASVWGSLGRVALVLLLVPLLRGVRDWAGATAAAVAGAAAFLLLDLHGLAVVPSQAAEATLALLALLLAIRTAAPEHPRATVATALAAVGAVVAVEAAHGHPGTVQTLAGVALLAPSLLSHAPRARRAGFLLQAGLFGMLAGAAFSNALRTVRLPLEAAALPETGYVAGTLLAAACVAASGAGVMRLLRQLRATAALVWAERLARTGVAAFLASLLLHALET